MYVPLGELMPDNDAQLFAALAAEITEVIEAIPRPPMAVMPEVMLPATLTDFGADFLPPMLEMLRGQQRLVLLLDDFDVLVDAVNDEKLPPELFAAFSKWIGKYNQLGMVIALRDTAGDAAAGEFGSVSGSDGGASVVGAH